MYQRRRYYVDPMGCVNIRLLRVFEVFKADLDAMAWVNVESLNNRILFLSENSCFYISAADVGVKGNRICCIPSRPDDLIDWFDFDMDYGILVTNSIPEHQRERLEAWMWFMPSLG
ncbi:hypothetical protein ACLOJK_035238 [Asimina triloba]